MAADAAPLITVIMPCFNAAVHVLAGMGSVLAQTWRDIELLVIDNASTDDTVRAVESVKDPRVRLLRESKRGVSAARNLGIARARGRFIAFLDSDDSWATDCLEKLHAALAAVPSAGLAYCGWQNVGLGGRRGEPYVPPDYEGPDKLARILPDCPWPIHAALTRTEAVREAGGFDERFAYAEDFGLWLRIAAAHPIVRVPEVLAFYHHHDGPRATRDLVRAARQLYAVQRDFLARQPLAAQRIGYRKARALINERMMERAFERYWQRDLDSAHAIFRLALRSGAARPKDWRYVLPAALPLPLFRALVHWADGAHRQTPTR